MMDWLTSLFTWDFRFDWETFVYRAGSDPFSAMGYLFLHGGWILFVWLILWAFKYGWLQRVQMKTAMRKEWIVLRIHIPKMHEQTPKAAENMFAAFAGAHTPFSWTEKWIKGLMQSQISVEIVSLEGSVGFYVRAERRMRDLVEAAIYAQYPDAEIYEVEDYTRNVPAVYPDEEWDLFGTEMVLANPEKRPDCYPIKTYVDFEDKVSGEFKDPVATLLENFSRLGPGEQAWYQIVITPTDQKDARARAEKEIKKLKGIKEEVKKTLLDHVVDLPMTALREVGGAIVNAPEAPVIKDSRQEFPKLFALSPGERFVLESIERKAGKIGHMCKIRFIYVAKKNIMMKPRAVHPFFGAIKQTNTFDMQSLKPESKRVGMNNNFWFFKDRRNNERKHNIMLAYRARSNWAGMPQFLLATDELATLWHFPILMQVKAPQLHKIEAKKSEAPPNLPFG